MNWLRTLFSRRDAGPADELIPYRWDALATYNAERSRGLVHTPEYDERMRVQQAQFNNEQLAEWDREGYEALPSPGGGWLLVHRKDTPPEELARLREQFQ